VAWLGFSVRVAPHGPTQPVKDSGIWCGGGNGVNEKLGVAKSNNLEGRRLLCKVTQWSGWEAKKAWAHIRRSGGGE